MRLGFIGSSGFLTTGVNWGDLVGVKFGVLTPNPKP